VKRFEDITEEDFRRTFETNIFGYFHMAQAAVPHLSRGTPSSTRAASWA
jgi:NAD(P)-dependent dehydrogenase (short-subunit alcohol dehydrogenase family)